MSLEKNYAGLDGFVWWMGVVENRSDPLGLGRCQVRIFGWNTSSLSDIPSDHLPWAHPVNALNTGTFTTPKEADMVFGFFADGRNAQVPIMMGIIPNFNADPATSAVGFNDIRTPEVIKKSPKKVVSRTYKTDGTGIQISEANTANSEVVESLRYPHADQTNRPSITGLSRNDLHSYDVISSRKNKSYPFIKTANDTKFKEPPPAYSPKYPFNQVLETESGHSLEFDDTPGSERITLAHRTGSFQEYYPTGSKIEEIVRNNFKIVLCDDHVYIVGKAMVTVDSDVLIHASGDIYLEGGNNLDVKVSGKMNLSVGEELNIKAKSLNIDITDDATLISKTQHLTASDELNVSGGSTKVSSDGELNLTAAGSGNFQAGGTMNLKGTSVKMGGGTVDVNGGIVKIDGGDVSIKKGAASPGGASSAATGSAAGIPAPDARNTKTDAPAYIDAGSTHFEIISVNDDFEMPKETYNKILADAGLPPTDTAPLAQDGAGVTPPAGGTNKTVVCGSVTLKDDYKQVQVSKNFTLADYTQGGSRKLQDQYGLTQAELLCNIVKLSENIVEPLLAAGFTFTITSCYRRGEADLPSGASHTSGGVYKPSDHDLARAVDMSAIKKNGVPVSAFDAATEMFSLVGKISKQFLLEYTTTGGPGWIHIAYADGTLKSAMPYGTLKDHATYARNQLVNLKPSAVA